ncbi:placenta-specific gene 8 protein [Biomphalaria glabrata]|nr:placenta-specific gene 8 protein [Biomphalaria glabrata]
MHYPPEGPSYITPTYHQTLQPVAAPVVTNQNTLSNTVVIGQTGDNGNGFLVIPMDKLQSRDWTSGICSCLNDFAGCILTFVCPAIMMCRLANRLDECAFLMYCTPGGAMALRTKLRTMGGIKGSICGDCVMTCCCCICCTMCQMSRELDKMSL